MPDNLRFELLKLEYAALRAEIVQSISYQHQILLGGYGTTGVFFGYIIGKPVEYLPALIAVPFILIGMASLWIVECNRMVRASYYIGRILWRALRGTVPPSDDKHWLSTEWEHWIRSKVGDASEFRQRQHRSQSVVVLRGPVVLSILSAGFAIYRGWKLDHYLGMTLAIAGLFAAWLWWRIRCELREISDLGATSFSDSPTDETRGG